jgi:hypothetical protein
VPPIATNVAGIAGASLGNVTAAVVAPPEVEPDVPTVPLALA